MRTTELYQIYDLKAESVRGPIMAYNRPGPAVRAFNELCANKESEIGRYPKDFHLLHIGTQDEETGEIESGRNTVIATGEAWLAAQTTNEENR